MRKFQSLLLKLTLFSLLFSTLASAAHLSKHSILENHTNCFICIVKDHNDDIELAKATLLPTIHTLYEINFLSADALSQTHFQTKARSPPHS